MSPTGIPPMPIDDAERRRALAKVYELLLRVADKNDNALSGNFGEETEKALEPTPTQVEACND
jgi:hypothetical protein